MTITVFEYLPTEAVSEVGAVDEHAAEWWYGNLLIEAPGTPIDGMALIVFFMRFRGFTEDLRAMIVSPDGGLYADFGTAGFAPGTLRASSDEMNVSIGPSWFRGAHPTYELHAEGEATNGAYISTRLSYTADVEPERAGYIDNQLKHFVIYRNRATGTITVGKNTYEVSGLGYFEHLFGTLGWTEPFNGTIDPPRYLNGWNWYWCPSAGPAELTVQAGSLLLEGEPKAFASVSVDGKKYEAFQTGKWDELEHRQVGGVPYAHKWRYTDSNDAGKVDLTFTRNEAAHRTGRDTNIGLRAVFVTGFVSLEGTVTLGGTTYDITDRAVGSVCKIEQNKALTAVRKLPAPVRVPLGRALKLARTLAARG